MIDKILGAIVGFGAASMLSKKPFGRGGRTDETIGYEIVDYDKYSKANISDVELDLIPSRTGSDGYEGDVTFIFVDKPEKTFSGGHGANDYLDEYGIRIN